MIDSHTAIPPVASTLACKYALLPEGWASDVCIGIDDQGDIVAVAADCHALPTNILTVISCPEFPICIRVRISELLSALLRSPGTMPTAFGGGGK